LRNRYFGICLGVVVAALMVMPGMYLVMPARGDPTPVAWTYAMYVNGDNDLERYWEDYSLPALLGIPASSGLKIVAMMDRMSTQGTELIEISGGSWQVVATYPEMNFGDGATFSWAISEMNALYPSDNLAVTAWDHGYAWRYFSNDQTSGDKITMPEMRTGIQSAGVYIDILAFDCCNMAAVEVVYEAGLTGLVGHVVASEETIPMNGFPYDLMLTPVANDPMRTPAQVAVDMVNGWAAYYDPLIWAKTVSLSAIDVGVMMQAIGTIDAWCERMYLDLAQYKRNFKNAVSASYCAWGTSYHVDLADLCDHIVADAGIKDATLKTMSTSVSVLVDDAVLAIDNGAGAGACRGMTLYWASKSDWKTYGSAYQTVSFAIDMNWYAFLASYNA